MIPSTRNVHTEGSRDFHVNNNDLFCGFNTSAMVDPEYRYGPQHDVQKNTTPKPQPQSIESSSGECAVRRILKCSGGKQCPWRKSPRCCHSLSERRKGTRNVPRPDLQAHFQVITKLTQAHFPTAPPRNTQGHQPRVKGTVTPKMRQHTRLHQARSNVGTSAPPNKGGMKVRPCPPPSPLLHPKKRVPKDPQ